MRPTASPKVERVELGPGKHSSAAASSLDFEPPQWQHTMRPGVHADICRYAISSQCALIVALPISTAYFITCATRWSPTNPPKTGSFWCRRLGIKSSWAQKAELDSAVRLIQTRANGTMTHYDYNALRCTIVPHDPSYFRDVFRGLLDLT